MNRVRGSYGADQLHRRRMEVVAASVDASDGVERVTRGAVAGHGHVRRQALVSRCGGPAICRICAAEAALLEAGLLD